MGVGKSSVAHLLSDKLKEKIKRLAYIPIDVSIYPFMRTHNKLSRKERGEIKQETLEIVFNNFLKRKFTIIIEGIFYGKYNNEQNLERLLKMAKKYKTEVVVFELHAHLEILHKRVKDRKKKNPYAWENPEDTEDRYKMFIKSLHKDAVIIETENKSPEKIVKEILEKIK